MKEYGGEAYGNDYEVHIWLKHPCRLQGAKGESRNVMITMQWTLATCINKDDSQGINVSVNSDLLSSTVQGFQHQAGI